MRPAFAIPILLLLPAPAFAQSPDRAARNQTILYLLTLHDPDSGGFKPTPDGKPGLRATSAAVRALRYIGPQPKPEVRQRAADFVMTCYDPATGGFADAPGGKPDVALTSIGVMAAVELGVPREKFARAMDYLKANAKTFDEVRIGAAAVEAWGVKDCPFDLKPWLAVADEQLGRDGTAGQGGGVARETASVIAMKLRLGVPENSLTNSNKLDDVLQAAQRPDGGYGKAGASGSDLESTYRVMRAFVLMRERPKEVPRMRAFIAKCRNPDGGYGVAPGEKSAVGGTYYAAIVTKWLDEMEGK
jgi:prenyltransferase beta subunit